MNEPSTPICDNCKIEMIRLSSCRAAVCPKCDNKESEKSLDAWGAYYNELFKRRVDGHKILSQYFPKYV